MLFSPTSLLSLEAAVATAQHNIMIDPAFVRLLARQREIQRIYLDGQTPIELDQDRKMAFLMETGTALMCEVTEALNETGWKPWASSNHINRDAYREELADIYIFLMNLMLIDDMTAMDLARLVNDKQDKNVKRQVDGYTGVKEKCPNCKAALDGAGIGCYWREDAPTITPQFWCDKAKDWFKPMSGPGVIPGQAAA